MVSDFPAPVAGIRHAYSGECRQARGKYRPPRPRLSRSSLFEALNASKLTVTRPEVYDLLQSAQPSQMPHPATSRSQVPTSQSPPVQSGAPGARDQTNIDPAISGSALLGGPTTPPDAEPTGEESPKSYGKRALSTSKRAAQNRAAQVSARLPGLPCLLLTGTESISPAQRVVYSETRGPGEGARTHVGQLQDPASGELPASGVRH